MVPGLLHRAPGIYGCLKVIPGCHRNPLMDHTRDNTFQGKITEAVAEYDVPPIEGKAGTAIFLHGMTPHASTTNTSERPRRTLILRYRAADAFPIYCGGMTVKTESHVRHVRGAEVHVARFALARFPIPQISGDDSFALRAPRAGRPVRARLRRPAAGTRADSVGTL